MNTDDYQKRYEAHQIKKAKVLMEIMKERHSGRVFSGTVTDVELDKIDTAMAYTPSSCDRKAVRHTYVADRHKKNVLSGLLVGGVGWIHRAPVIMLLWAEMTAYKSPDERIFMPYLDAGHLSMTVQLACESINLTSCFCNPNCRFTTVLNDLFMPAFCHDILFVGAIAIGAKNA